MNEILSNKGLLNIANSQNVSSVGNADMVINPVLNVEGNRREAIPELINNNSVDNVITLESPETLCHIRIQDIVIPDVLDKLYDSKSKTNKIDELKNSISEYGQKQPIVVVKILDHTFLVDGRLRVIAMDKLNFTEVTAIYTPFDPLGDMSLEALILQHHIRKELTVKEKLNEIKFILRIDEDAPNPYRDLEKRRTAVSLKLGNKFKRSSIYEFEKILRFERDNDFGLGLSEKIIDGKLKVSDGKSLIELMGDNKYTPLMEDDSKIVNKYLNGIYNLDETERLINIYQGKIQEDRTYNPSFPHATERYEIRQGNVLDVDLSDVSFDVIFSSPPYYSQRKYGDNEKQEIGNEQTREGYIKMIVDAFEKGWNQLNERGSLFVNINDTYKDGFSLNIIESFVKEMECRGMRKVDTIFWEKQGAKPSNNNIHRLYSKTEYIIHFAKSKDYIWNPVGKLKKSMVVTKSCGEIGIKQKVNVVPNKYSNLSTFLNENNLNEIDDYVRFSNIIKTKRAKLGRKYEKGEEKHTATFSETVPLIPLLLTCPRDRQAIVGDIFSGTSTTGEVALALGHRYVGVELYEKNVDISSRVLFNAEQKYQHSIFDELFENNEIEYADAA